MTARRFYFAWVDPTETTFEDSHKREDEQIFGFTLQQAEGDFASLDIDLRNPRIGLLASSRKQWAWLAYRAANDTVTPVFFGRLVGIPQDMQNEVIRLSFVARPVDFEEQRAALAASLQVAPYWDPLWFSAEEAADPDRVLEGRSALWHIDRTTGVVSLSDIVTGEDGTLDFSGPDAFYDSVSVSYSQSPASKCTVKAVVNWAQKGSGDIDITNDILEAFAGVTTSGVFAVDGGPRTSEGTVNIIAGDSMVANWPKFGASIGGGWTVGASFAETIGDPPLPPILVGNSAAMNAVRLWKDSPGSRNALREIFDRSPGFVVAIEDTSVPWTEHGWLSHGDVNVLWLPIWQIAVGMKLHWETSRARSETLQFSITADVQPLLTDPGADEVILLTVGPADVDTSIDPRSKRFFATDRGRRSIAHLIARARANLLSRARAIDVAFATTFERGLALSLRKNATLQDPRLPAGIAAGKIKAYSLTANGDTGELSAALTMGCSVGRGGNIEVVRGDPEYVEDGYVEDGYQEMDGEIIVPLAGDIGYSIGDYSVEDDGVNLFGVHKSGYLLSLNVKGGLDEQKAAASSGVASSTAGVIDRINGVKTEVKLTVRPVNGGPFDSNASLSYISDLKVPRTIDLEETGTA